MAQCSFLEILNPQNVLIMLLFSMKYLYLLTAKITPYIDSRIFKSHGKATRFSACFTNPIMASTKLI